MMAVPVIVSDGKSITVTRPQLVAAVGSPPVQVFTPGCTGFPATYRVWLFRKPTVAPPGMGSIGPVTSFTRSSTCRLAVTPGAPPHSGPQFKIQAVVPSLLKNPKTGRLNPLTVVQTGGLAGGGSTAGTQGEDCPGTTENGERIDTESELSLNPSRRLPSGLWTM